MEDLMCLSHVSRLFDNTVFVFAWGKWVVRERPRLREEDSFWGGGGVSVLGPLTGSFHYRVGFYELGSWCELGVREGVYQRSCIYLPHLQNI